MQNAKEEQIKQKEEDAFKLTELEHQKEPVKAELQKKFITPLMRTNSGYNIDLPNCVMLTGENPYVMQELIEWTGEVSDADFVKLPSLYSKGDMIDNLYDTLANAEKNYQNTGKRSIIFVNGMSKLLEEKNNSKTDIADMKYIMNAANKNFHSTIMFYSKNPSEFAPGINAIHRIGLKINVPIDMDVKL